MVDYMQFNINVMVDKIFYLPVKSMFSGSHVHNATVG